MEVVIIGCGVIGLTSGIVLQEAGWPVRIITRELPEQTVSSVAAAIWFPFKAYPLERVIGWGQKAFQKYQALTEDPSTGVSMVTLWELYPEPIAEPWWQAAVPTFSHIAAADLPTGYGDAIAVTVPLIETPLYLAYLLHRFRSGGGIIEERTVTNIAEEARPQTLIVNCTGLSARDLVHDPELYPIRGQILRVSSHTPIPTILDEHHADGLTYIIPRRDGVILGGTIQENDWRLTPDETDAQGIWQRATRLVPALTRANILAHRVGLRPGRPTIRLEREWLTPDCPVIHNYGHGGAGFTLSWGCADELLTLAQNL
ncbi:MAG: FAD-dependent oxidoreductase [Candidatus Promineifilaceae bacterium]